MAAEELTLHLVLVWVLVIFVCVSKFFNYNALARTILSLCPTVFERAELRRILFCLSHRTFQRKKRSGWRKRRDEK